MFPQVSVCPQGEVSAPGGGGCLVCGGVCMVPGGVCSRGVPGPRGCLVLGGIPACTEADPRERRLLLRTVRILLECILVLVIIRLLLQLPDAEKKKTDVRALLQVNTFVCLHCQMFQTMFKKICARGQSPNFYKTNNLKEEKSKWTTNKISNFFRLTKNGWNKLVADPVFPRGISTNSKGGCEKLLFNQFFFKNCMEWKEFGPRGVRASLVLLLDPPMVIVIRSQQNLLEIANPWWWWWWWWYWTLSWNFILAAHMGKIFGTFGPSNWHSAKSTCEGQGRKLLTIDSQAEEIFAALADPGDRYGIVENLLHRIRTLLCDVLLTFNYK